MTSLKRSMVKRSISTSFLAGSSKESDGDTSYHVWRWSSSKSIRNWKRRYNLSKKVMESFKKHCRRASLVMRGLRSLDGYLIFSKTRALEGQQSHRLEFPWTYQQVRLGSISLSSSLFSASS